VVILFMWFFSIIMAYLNVKSSIWLHLENDSRKTYEKNI
jgi:hypothetical protein